MCLFFFFFNDTATTEIYTLSLHDALPISSSGSWPHFSSCSSGRPSCLRFRRPSCQAGAPRRSRRCPARSEEHTSELQSRLHLVCRLLLEKKKSRSALLSSSAVISYAVNDF